MMPGMPTAKYVKRCASPSATIAAAVAVFIRLGEQSVRLMRPSLFSTLASDPGLGRKLTQQLLDLVEKGVVKPEVHKVSVTMG